MPFAAGVKFSEEDFPEYFNPGDVKLAAEDFCVAKHPDLGVERIGFVTCLEGRAPIQMGHLPRILRLATEAEIETWYELKIKEKDARLVVMERAAAHDLPIKISGVNFLSEKAQVLVYFTSDRRVDFRELVKDLAGRFKSRIEMWQLRPREEAGRMDGYGICGMRLCCSSWLKDFPTITMRHAKDQDIVQPPSKLSGACGRLRCCLRYEHEQYVAMAVGAPALGCAGKAGSACGVAVDRSLLKSIVTLQQENGERVSVPFADFVADPDQKDRRKSKGRSDRDRRGGGAEDDERAESYEG